MPAPASEQRDAQGRLPAVVFGSATAHRLAPEDDCLIAVGSCGPQAGNALLQSSVTYRLIRLCRVPVLVARQRSPAAGRLPAVEQAVAPHPFTSNARKDSP